MDLPHPFDPPVLPRVLGLAMGAALLVTAASPGAQSGSFVDNRFLVEDQRRADRRGFYLLSITRSRIDGTGGLKGSLLRPIISRRSRTAVRGYLEDLKRQVESAAPAA